MRRFLVVTTEKLLQERPSLHAKLLTGALLISNAVRKDAEVVYIFRDLGISVRVIGSKVKRLFPDVESSYGFLKKALRGGRQEGVLVSGGWKDVAVGRLAGPGAPSRCLPHPPFTYIVKLVDTPERPDCDFGLGHLPPHHQVVVANVMADRLVQGRRV